ncbi:MAG: carbohydrate kinase family protein [bacterium]|nr:carbohydrate kinase family protein [bacterium]
MENNYDFIAIGDTVTDAFIELEDAEVERDDGLTKICMRFGDKIPYKDVHVVAGVGNSANAAVSAARLGLKSALVANVGDDYFGEECLNALKKEGLGTEFIKINEGKKTNYHYVLLFKSERTILIKHEEYDYKLPASPAGGPDIGKPKWIYLSSFGANSLPFHSVLERYLNENPEIKLAFQPGTYQIKFGKDALAGIYERSDLFFCNKEESQKILETKENDIKELLKGVFALGVKIPVITDGRNGAFVYDGKEFWQMPMYPDPKPPVDRTGAGDSFSSAFTAAIALGKSIPEALRWGPINSMSVVQQIGARAGLLTREQLEENLAKAPEDYQPKLI